MHHACVYESGHVQRVHVYVPTCVYVDAGVFLPVGVRVCMRVCVFRTCMCVFGMFDNVSGVCACVHDLGQRSLI